MNGKQLKNSILQWAIQGKLVPPVCRQAGKTLMTNPVPRDKGKECWFTYVIECEDGSFYKGFTDNLLRRYQQHCNGTGADYTKTHKPKQLYYWEMHYSKEAALQREKYLKSGAGREWFKKEVVDKPENFEPASILLDKIRKEKERLIKEKKIKRDKNASIIYRGEDNSYYEKILATGEVKCIDDEVPFEIPKGWEWCRIRDLYDFIDYRGATPHKLSKGIPLITAKNVKQGYLDYTIKDFISSEEYSNRLSRGVSHKGDILFTTEAPLGNVAIADLDVHSTGQRLITLQAYIPCYTNNDMFMFFMLSPLFQESVISYKTGTTVAGIKASKLKEVLIPTPPISEQFHIVKKTRTLLPFIEKYSTSQALLNKSNSEIKDKLGKSILQEAIQGKLVPQIAGEGTAQELLEQIKVEKLKLVKEGKLKKSALNDSVIFRGDDNKYYEQVGSEVSEIELPFDFPSSWSIARLNAVCQLTDGLKTTGKLCLLDAKYLRGKSSETIVEQGKLVCKGDNIILVDGENSGEVFNVPQDGYMGSTFKQLWINSSMYKPYVLAFIQFYKETLRNSKKGAAIPHLNKELFYGLIIGIPPLQEQRRIVHKIEESAQVLK